MKYLFFYVLFCFLFLSCTNKKEPVKTIKAKQIDTPVKISKSVIYRRLLNSSYNVGPDLRYHDKVGAIDTITVQQITYHKKSVFIYSDEYLIDTLTCYKDFAYTAHSGKLIFLKGKKINFRNNEIEVDKYQYTPNIDNKHVHAADGGFAANVFINDSLGIILLYAKGQGSAILEYDIQNKDLHKSMLRDSVFFKFEYHSDSHF